MTSNSSPLRSHLALPNATAPQIVMSV